VNPLPLIFSFGLFCFCLTGPVSWPFVVFSAFVLGWCAGLFYVARTIDNEW